MADSAYVWCKGISIHALRKESDTQAVRGGLRRISISIHALRKESDLTVRHVFSIMLFQSTLSVRRATLLVRSDESPIFISIHALRKESDLVNTVGQTHVVISIHALRKESDNYSNNRRIRKPNFNPRSP